MPSEKIRPQLVAAIVATGLMSFAGVVSETAMNVTFPTLMRAFAIDTAAVQWPTTGYWRPAVLVAGRTAIPHGELAEVGIVSAYALESAGAPRDATARPVAWNAGGRRAVRGRLVEMGARLASSWSR